MKTHLFNLLTQSFKEKNLIFDAPKGGEAAKAEASKDAAPAKPEAAKGAEKKPETPEEKKAKIKEAIGALTPKFEQVLAKDSGYTEDFIKETKKIKEKFEEITKKLEGNKKLDKANLKIFNEKLEKSYEDKSLERNKNIQAQRVALEAEKTNPELTAEKIWEEQKAMLIEGDFSESILEAIKEKFNAEGRLKNQFEFVSKILDGAEKGASDENADKNLAEATKEIKNLTKEFFTTKDFTAQYNAVLEEVKKIDDFPKDVKTLGEKASAAKTAIFDKIAEDIKKSKEGKPLNPNSFVAYQQEIMYAHVADVLGDEELTPEKIKSAISLYDLGKFKPGKESAEAKKTLDKLLSPEIKDKLIAAGIRIDFMGGTDGTDHQFMKSKEWHDEKVTAFDKLVAFDSAGHLNPPLTADNKTEIEAYKAAVAAGTQADFLNDAAHKDKFLSGGTLFDQALALQRAEDKAERVKESFDPAQRYLNIELGNSTAADNEEKKSGIAFNIEEKPEVDETKPQYEVKGGTVVVTLPKDPQKPNDVPVKLTYTLSTVPSLQAELKPGNPPTITVEGRVATLELEGDKLVAKDKDPNDPEKKFSAYCTVTIVKPEEGKSGTIQLEKTTENQPDYKVTLEGNKLSVKYSDEEKAREFTVGKLPEGMTAALDDGDLALTLGEDKSLIRFDDKEKIGISFFFDNMSLNRSFTVALDAATTPPTIKVEKREEDVAHGYIYNEKTKVLTYKNKDSGEVKEYTINAPEGAIVRGNEEESESSNADWALKVTLGEESSYLKFDRNGEFLVYGAFKKDLYDRYDIAIAADGKTINFTPKLQAPEKGADNTPPLDNTQPAATLPETATPDSAENFAAPEAPPAADPEAPAPNPQPTDDPEAPAPNPQPVEKPETKPAEFGYKLSPDGKTLSFKDTTGATFNYSIIKPAEANIALSDGDDKYFVVELNGAKASFEFNPQTGQFETGPIVDAKDLRDNYTIEAKSTSTPRTISILKKEAVVNNPPPAPLRASFKTNAEYNAAYDKYDKDVWKPWAAKQIEANKAAVTKIETPDPETNGSEKIIKDQIKKIEAFIKQKGISVIDFSSTDCGPCQWMKPLLYQLAGQGLNHGSESVKFANFNQNSMGDGQDSKALETFMKKYGINSFPSLLVFKDGKLIVSSSGREDNKDKLKAKLTAALVAHDENPDAVIDTYTTELLGKIKSKSFEKNPVGTYGNLQARTVIAITSDWKDLEPKAWGLQCHYETGGLGSGDQYIIRYKDPETGKYLYFDGGHKLIELGEKPPKPEEHKAILKELFKDFVPGTYFEKLEEPVYLNETNTWSVKFKYSAASEAEEKKEKNEYRDAISYLTKYLDSKGLYVNNRIQGGSLSYSNNNVIIAVEDVDSFKDIKPPLVLSGNTLTFTPRGGQPKNYVLPSGYIYEPYFKVDSVEVFEKKNNVNIHLGSISFSDGKPSAFSMKEGVVTVENDVIKIVSPKD